MKTRLIASGLALALAGAAQADFNPVPLTQGSYDFAIVVPSNTVQAVPYCLTADTQTGVALNGASFSEQGFYAQPGQPDSYYGIPAHNSILTNIHNPNITFLMPPDYTTNNDLQIDGSGSPGSYSSGTFTLVTPVSATNLALLGCDGGGDNYFQYVVHHEDGSSDSGYVYVPDWTDGGSGTNANFSGGHTTHSVAWGADSSVLTGCEEGCEYLGDSDVSGGDGGSFNNNTPYLYSLSIPISGASPVTSIDLNWYDYHSGAIGNFYAVSGNLSGSSWTPLPVTGFNQTTTIAATVPYPVTATMDSGPDVAAGGNTWFEQGYYHTQPSDGLPHSGSTFSSQSNPSHHFQMGDYSANSAALIDSGHSASLAPSNPGLYSGFSLLLAGANIGNGNKMTNTCILQHEDGVRETNVLVSYDWFDTSASSSVAWSANGNIYLNNRTLESLNVSGGVPYLFEGYFEVNHTNSVVTNVLVQYGSAPYDNSATYVMASGADIIVVSPSFSGLSSQGSIYGTNSVVLGGKISAPGIVYAGSGETITVTINGVSQTTTIDDSTGDFSISFDPSSIPASETPYTVTYAYAGDENLLGVTNSATTLTVEKAPLTITALPQTITYGAAVPATTLAYSGFVNGQSSAALSAQPNISSSRSGVVGAGSYSGNYIPSGAAAANYFISYVDGTLTVNPATLTVTAQPQSIIYGQSVPGTTVIYAGFTNGDTSASLTTLPTASSIKSGVVTVGSYAGNYVPAGAVDANYHFNYVNGALSVSSLAVVLTGSEDYNGTTNAEGTNLVVTNALGGDSVEVVSGTAGMSGANVGSNAITSVAALSLGGSSASNYTLIGAAGFVTVTPLPVTLTGTKVFDGTATASSASLVVVTNYDGANLVLAGSATLAGPSLGTENIIDFSSLVLGGSAAADYTLTDASGTVTITDDSVTELGGLTLVTNGYGTIEQATLPSAPVIGSRYIVTAMPDPQNLFSSWLGGTAPPYTVLSTSSNYTFTMQSNLVLVANFVTNIFPSSAGSYNGIFVGSNGVSEQTSGMLRQLTINNKGKYTATLLINGDGHSLSGEFAPAGLATNIVKRAAGAGGPLEVELTLNANVPPFITGTILGASGDASWQAYLYAEEATNAYASAEYTVLIGPDTNDAPPVSSPGGYGYMTITNSSGTPGHPATATAILLGTLADGTAYRQAVPVSVDGNLPIYADLYSGKGLLLGWINLSTSNFSGNDLTWIRPHAGSGLYKGGFTNYVSGGGIQVSEWSDPAPGLDLLTNITFLDTVAGSNDVALSVATSAVGKISGSSIKGSINPSTGVLTVTVGSGAGKVTGYGAVLLNSTNGGGYFLTKSNAEAFILSQ